jgi:Domain of unknown function (DUF4129)
VAGEKMIGAATLTSRQLAAGLGSTWRATQVAVARASSAVEAGNSGNGGDLGPVDQNPDDVRDQACQILSRPCTPYEPPKPTGGKPPSGDFSFAGVIVNILLIALIAAIVFLIVWYLRKVRLRTPDEDIVEDAEPISERIIDHSRPPDHWRAAADEHFAAGRYREALRCRYRALVGDLARRGLLDEIPGRTTGEERAQLAVLAPVSSPAFTRASSMFDDVWYGAADVSRADHDRFVAEEDIVLAGAPKRGSLVSR